MSMNINLKHINEFKRLVLKKANRPKIRSKLLDWSTLLLDGRIVVGWKRIAIGYANYWQLSLNMSNVVNFKPLSTLEIIRKKIDRWRVK